MKKLLVYFLLFGSSYLTAQQWSRLSSGMPGGIVYALSLYNGNLIASGLFNMSGGVLTDDIAQWNGTSWDSISNSPYLGISLYAECVYNDSLIVAGYTAGNSKIIEWNGTNWLYVSPAEYYSIDAYVVFDFSIYQGNLYAGGIIGKNFHSASNIAVWNGSHWDTLPTGVIKKNGSPSINIMTVYNSNLYVGGNFDTAGNISAKNIAMWNGSTWSAVGEGFNGRVSSLYVYNGTLYAAGGFDSSGSQPVNNIASWNGTKWNPLGSGIRDGVINSLVAYGSVLCAAGAFDSAGGQSVNNIAYWDGSNWYPLGSGITGGSVYCLSTYKGALIAAGAFDSADGLPANNIAQWTSPLGIDNLSAILGTVNAYPNPSDGKFTITLSHINLTPAETRFQPILEIYTMLGQQVYYTTLKQVQGNNVIDLSSEPNGIYLYRVVNETGSSIGEGKFIIQK